MGKLNFIFSTYFRWLSMLAGFDRHLTKPASLDDLKSIVGDIRARGAVMTAD